MSEFLMPSLGADMDAGTLVRWRVSPGDAVRRGQVVAEVETDKGVVEVEIWEDAVVDAIVTPVGVKVPVGAVLATLRGASPEATAPVVEAPPTRAPPTPPSPRAAPAPSPPPVGPRDVMASPAARRRARELGVDLSSLQGTGHRGAVTVDDVERVASPPAPREPAAPATPAATAAPKDDRAAAMRRAIAAAMARSKREIPHYYLSTQVDMSRALAWLAEENGRRSVTERILPAALQLRAVALALRKAPALNGYWEDGALRPGDGVHLGVAIALRGGGLVAPALHDADARSLSELMAALSDLTARARGGALRSSELTAATVTVTNLGEQGVESVFGVIYPPQVALVGFGKTTERPWAVRGLLGVRPVVTVTLAADHRASDGHVGARFLSTVDELLSEPEAL